MQIRFTIDLLSTIVVIRMHQHATRELNLDMRNIFLHDACYKRTRRGPNTYLQQ
jgi:hypothetical protein